MIELLYSVRIHIYLLIALFAYAISEFGISLDRKPLEFISLIALVFLLMHFQRKLVLVEIMQELGINPEDNPDSE